jgi:hypothetical protein
MRRRRKKVRLLIALDEFESRARAFRLKHPDIERFDKEANSKILLSFATDDPVSFSLLAIFISKGVIDTTMTLDEIQFRVGVLGAKFQRQIIHEKCAILAMPKKTEFALQLTQDFPEQFPTPKHVWDQTYV